MKESGLRENCTIRLTERTEEGANRPPSTLHVAIRKDRTSNSGNKRGFRELVYKAEFRIGTRYEKNG